MHKVGEKIVARNRSFRSSQNESNSFTPATASGFHDSFTILFRWKESVYRLLWMEFLFYMAIYISISALYFYVFDCNTKRIFDDLAKYCSKFVSSLQIVLLLGFFTSTAMQRWFALVNNVPGTTKVTALFVHSLKENQPEGIQIVQQYARWILLSWTLVFRLVCPSLRDTYPDLMSLQKEGLLLDHERIQLEMEPEKSHPRIVINWNLALLRLCARRGMYYTVSDYTKNLDCLMTFKKSCNSTIKFAYKNIPSALIQVVSIAVYVYGLASLMLVRSSKSNKVINVCSENLQYYNLMSIITGYVPGVAVVQFFLFYSWLKFGRIASNPFGQDKDDINVTQLLHCHIEDAFQIQALYSDTSLIEKLAMASIKHPSHIWIDHASRRERQSETRPFTTEESTF